MQNENIRSLSKMLLNKFAYMPEESSPRDKIQVLNMLSIPEDFNIDLK